MCTESVKVVEMCSFFPYLVCVCERTLVMNQLTSTIINSGSSGGHDTRLEPTRKSPER